MASDGAHASPVEAFERNLIRGGARWIADLNEFFKDYQAEDTSFTLYARGRTRNTGFMISRFFAWTVLPNYSVALYCIDEKNNVFGLETLRTKIELVTRLAKNDELQWAWLIIFSERNIQPAVVAFVSRYDRKDLGVAIASVESNQIVLSNNQLGKSIEKQLGLKKALGDARTRNN